MRLVSTSHLSMLCIEQLSQIGVKLERGSFAAFNINYLLLAFMRGKVC